MANVVVVFLVDELVEDSVVTIVIVFSVVDVNKLVTKLVESTIQQHI